MQIKTQGKINVSRFPYVIISKNYKKLALLYIFDV